MKSIGEKFGIRVSLALLCLMACLSILEVNALARVQIRDFTGTEIVLPKPPERVVTLAPSLAELVFELSGNKGSLLVGVSDYTDFPESLKSIPSVGSFARVNLEKIVSLKPDLVIATADGNPKDQIRQLRKMKIPVLVTSTTTFDEIQKTIKQVGSALGRDESAKTLVHKLGSTVTSIRERRSAQKGTTKARILLQAGADPLVVVGGHSFLNEALEIVGVTNVFGDLQQSYPRPSMEEVFKRKPDRILVLSMEKNPDVEEQMLRRWKELKTLLPAGVKVSVFKDDGLLRPSGRLAQGLLHLEQELYRDDL